MTGKYYPIDEEVAKRAQAMWSFRDYVTGTKTKYSVGWRPAKYLREDPQHYKNKGMARYYGVDTIIGTYQK